MENINITGTIQHETADPVSIELARGQRGGYGWTIKVRGQDAAQILAAVDGIDRQLRDKYLSPEEPA